MGHMERAIKRQMDGVSCCSIAMMKQHDQSKLYRNHLIGACLHLQRVHAHHGRDHGGKKVVMVLEQ